MDKVLNPMVNLPFSLYVHFVFYKLVCFKIFSKAIHIILDYLKDHISHFATVWKFGFGSIAVH